MKDGMLEPDDVKKMKGKAWIVGLYGKAIELGEVEIILSREEHPADTFDRLTAAGFKLDLVTGKYQRPRRS